MTDRERSLWLRRLRFPEPLERDFRHDFALKSLAHTRFVFGLLTILFTGCDSYLR